MAPQRYQIMLCRERPELMTLDMLAERAGVHPELVERFVEFGLIEPVQQRGAVLLFDAIAVPRLQTMGRLRQNLGVNLAGIAVIMNLLDRFCALQQANESLQSRL